jgi:hypothetical protein
MWQKYGKFKLCLKNWQSPECEKYQVKVQMVLLLVRVKHIT